MIKLDGHPARLLKEQTLKSVKTETGSVCVKKLDLEIEWEGGPLPLDEGDALEALRLASPDPEDGSHKNTIRLTREWDVLEYVLTLNDTQGDLVDMASGLDGGEPHQVICIGEVVGDVTIRQAKGLTFVKWSVEATIAPGVAGELTRLVKPATVFLTTNHTHGSQLPIPKAPATKAEASNDDEETVPPKVRRQPRPDPDGPAAA